MLTGGSTRDSEIEQTHAGEEWCGHRRAVGVGDYRKIMFNSSLRFTVLSRLSRGSVPILLAAFALAVGAASSQAGAQTATATTLAVTSAGKTATDVPAGTVMTLTATVKAGATPLTRGLVNFCVVSKAACTDVHLLGSAQLTKAGTAAIKLRPGPGSHDWKAVFAGTTSYKPSASRASALTVADGISLTGTTIAPSGKAGDYTLTATVAGAGSTAPSGTVSFLDSTQGNSVIAKASLAEGGPGFSLFNAPNPPFAGFVGEGDANAVAVADFNGDGIPDIAAASPVYSYDDGDPYVTGGVVAILLGNGDGTFKLAPNSPSAGVNPTSIVVADFNGDGIPDMAVCNSDGGGITILLGNGDGTFKAAASLSATGVDFIAVGDFNGDGIPDIVANDLTVFLGKGNGTFTQVAPQSGGGSNIKMVVADFNGDGILDLATILSTDDGSLTILLGDGDGTFTALPSMPLWDPFALVEGDFNEDGIPDLAVGVAGILLGNGDGTFTAKSSFGNPFNLALGDFNGDGHADLALATNLTGDIGFLLGNGNGTFTSAPGFYSNEAVPLPIASADLAGSGRSALITNDPQLDVSVYLSEAWTATATVTGVAVLPKGSAQHQVLASYAGGSNNAPSESAATATLTAAQGTPTVTLNVPKSPVYYGSGVTFTAKVSGSGLTPTGAVNFFNGKTPLGSATLNSSGVATLSASTLAVGSHSITADYLGDANYVAANSAPATVTVGPEAQITSPAAGSTLTGPSTTFTWSAGYDATSYKLWLGSTGVDSNNLYSGAGTTGKSATATLPVNGETIYARLFTESNGTWTAINYTYTAAAQAKLTVPAAGSKVTGPSMKFSWSAATPSPTAYDLWVGTTGVGSANIYSSGSITATSTTVGHLPTSGTVYVRLYTEFGDTWVHTDYTFTAN